MLLSKVLNLKSRKDAEVVANTVKGSVFWVDKLPRNNKIRLGKVEKAFLPPIGIFISEYFFKNWHDFFVIPKRHR